MKDALCLLAGIWALAMIVGGMAASIGLLAFPWSSRPLWCFGTGVAGVIVQVLGAMIFRWLERR